MICRSRDGERVPKRCCMVWTVRMKGCGLEKVRVVVQEVLHWSDKVLIRDGAGYKKCDMEGATLVREGVQGRGTGWGSTEGSGMDWEGLTGILFLFLFLPFFFPSFMYQNQIY